MHEHAPRGRVLGAWLEPPGLWRQHGRSMRRACHTNVFTIILLYGFNNYINCLVCNWSHNAIGPLISFHLFIFPNKISCLEI